jgi:hypothetical protein
VIRFDSNSPSFDEGDGARERQRPGHSRAASHNDHDSQTGRDGAGLTGLEKPIERKSLSCLFHISGLVE